VGAVAEAFAGGRAAGSGRRALGSDVALFTRG
jgi:hypothetical protein